MALLTPDEVQALESMTTPQTTREVFDVAYDRRYADALRHREAVRIVPADEVDAMWEPRSQPFGRALRRRRWNWRGLLSLLGLAALIAPWWLGALWVMGVTR